MPTFVIHHMGQPSRRLSLDSSPVRVGRDAECDIVIADASASREHAVFMSDDAGHWHVGCVSDTNPIVVNGALVSSTVPVRDGDEVLIGAAHMVLFLSSDASASQRIAALGTYTPSECLDCDWTGRVGTYGKTPVCPRCGGHRVASQDAYRREDAAADAPGGTTRVLPGAEAQELFRKLHEARTSYLDRRDGREEGPQRVALTEGQAVRIARDAKADLRLYGFTLGGGLKITWGGSFFVVDSALLFPSMRLNGVKAIKGRLRNGDMIEVGSNRFAFVTG